MEQLAILSQKTVVCPLLLYNYRQSIFYIRVNILHLTSYIYFLIFIQI